MPGKWTKADVRRLCSAIDAAWIARRPLGVDPEFLPRWRAWLAETGRRRAIAVAHLRGFANMLDERAKQERDTATHYRERLPDPVLVERFERLAGETARDAARARKLAERVEFEGVPPEVERYDPTDPATKP